ncbi:hypothetical protein [Pseudomonas soli]|uniref:hypothetical protein n=1 Tax=Pseudomonas soli TaxID=1306993 RepID=UPI0003C7DCAC|nr:hypothetical protein O165_006665 [Pseudomonas soli]
MSGSGKAIGAALVLVGAAIGWVSRGFKDKGEKEKLKDVAERRGHDLETVLKTFEVEASRMEKIITAISTENPSSATELTALLKKYGLNQLQITKIVSTRFPETTQSGAA